MRFAQRAAENRPILLSGDFNAEPNEPVYSTIINYNPLGLSSAYADLLASLSNESDNDIKSSIHTDKSIDDKHNDMDVNEKKNRVDHLIDNEPPFTTWKIREDGEVCHTIDYIFYSSDKLKVSKAKKTKIVNSTM